MITIINANIRQKGVVTGLLKVLLSLTEFTSIYTIEISQTAISLRENRENPPHYEHTASMAKMMERMGLIFEKILYSYQPRTMDAYGSGGTDFRVLEINESIINEIIAQAERKPENVNEIVWFFLPKVIKEHWDVFTKPLQNYLVDCIKYSIPKLLDDKSDAKIDFPVLLKKTSAEVTYNLLNLLTVQEFDPKDLNRRRHPVGDDFFSLQEVLPASAHLKKLGELFIKILSLDNDDEIAPAAAGIAAPCLRH